MPTEELDAQVLAHVQNRPGSSVWDLCLMFPQEPAPEVQDRPGLYADAPRMVPSVKPAQVVESLRRLRQDGRVRMTKDPGERGAERWYATDY